MFSSSFVLLTLALWAAVTHQSGFTSPNYVVAYGTGQYESNTVWYVGENKEVVYDVSDIDGLDNYTIALWQQAITGGGATLGPVVNSTTLPDVRDSFSWEVQLYDFDLSVSNVFFFWLFNGSSSNQGDTSVRDFSSSYFNISSDDPPGSSTSSATATSSGSSTSTAGATSTASADAASATDAAATSTAASGAGSSGSSSSSSGSGGGGISTGAGIGIGVGVGLAGFSAVVCAALVVWYKRRKVNSSRAARGIVAFNELHELPPDGDAHTKSSGWFASQGSSSYDTVPKEGQNMAIYGSQGTPMAQPINYGYPAELNGGGIYGAAEMDAQDTRRR